MRSFFGHASFYWRFIKDFSKIAHPLCRFLKKECKFHFVEACLKAFGELKEKLVSAPNIISPDWSKPFEVMCDASGVALVWYWDKEGKKSFIPFTMLVNPLVKHKRTTP